MITKQQQRDPSSSTTRQGAPFSRFSASWRIRENGQLMIESMVAISMVMIGLLGIMTLLIRSSQWNRDVGLKLRATYLAAEGIEVVKNIIDTNIAEMLSDGGIVTWNTGLGSGGAQELTYETREGALRAPSPRPLYFDPARGYGYDAGGPSPFTRIVTISGTGENPIIVRSEVSWGLGKKVVVENVFTFWRKHWKKSCCRERVHFLEEAGDKINF